MLISAVQPSCHADLCLIAQDSFARVHVPYWDGIYLRVARGHAWLAPDNSNAQSMIIADKIPTIWQRRSGRCNNRILLDTGSPISVTFKGIEGYEH